MVTMYLSSGKYALLLVACVCVSAYAAPKQNNNLNENRETVRAKRVVGVSTLGPMVLQAVDGYLQSGFRDVHQGTTVHPITGIIAQNFGTVKGIYRQMDEKLQRTVSIIAKQITTLPEHSQTNWQDIVNLFSNSPFLRVVDGSHVHRVKELNLGSRGSIFKVDGSPNEQLVSQVNDWFRNTLVIDADVLAATRITGDELRKVANIVAQSGATVRSLATVVHRREIHTEKVIDINVIRFPDIDNPKLKLYRIELTATSDCERFLMYQTDRNKVNGIFQSMEFEKRDSALDAMSPELIQGVADYGNTLFP